MAASTMLRSAGAALRRSTARVLAAAFTFKSQCIGTEEYYYGRGTALPQETVIDQARLIKELETQIQNNRRFDEIKQFQLVLLIPASFCAGIILEKKQVQ
uniref:Uncharacterized protein n=1 Tax=Oryza meridionalis TaxID=40149 RepID=A0A0E0CT87_9ORYZ